MSEEGGERTEEASERQIEKFRQEGKVATSKELSAAVSLGGGVIGLLVAVPWLGEAFLSVARQSFGHASAPRLGPADVPTLTTSLLAAVGPGVAVALGPGALLAVGAGLLVTGFNLSTEAIEPKLERLDPIGGATRLVSPQSLEQLVKAVIVFGLVGWATWSALSPHVDALPAAATWSAAAQARMLAEVVKTLLVRATIAAVAVGAADFGFQKWRLSRQMMMTRQQVKEEHKDTEGVDREPHP